VSAQPEWLSPVLERLERVEAMLADLLCRRAVKDWYSTDEVAQILGRAPSPSANGAETAASAAGRRAAAAASPGRDRMHLALLSLGKIGGAGTGYPATMAGPTQVEGCRSQGFDVQVE
jgi:hypothetical protein